jgi:ribosomal protein S18 acetylase RimI-like enzyme
MKSERTELNRRIQEYLRVAIQRSENHSRIGPFLAGFDDGSDNPYRNYAVPDEGARPSAADIEALNAAFATRSRRPRLEYIAETAPEVEAMLLASGFEVEKRYPILVCTADTLRAADSTGIDVTLVQNDEDIVAAADVGAEAYDDKLYSDPLRRLVAQGGALAIARDPANGMVVGAGMATPSHEGVSEIAGIGVRLRYRRRGIAGAVTACVTREAFARGTDLVWLTPGHDDAERIYARAGFVRASEQLHISRPK